MPGTLFVVATPIGNLEDVTVRALRVLREVALIAAEDTRRTSRLLARYAIQTPTTSLHEHNEQAKSASLVERLRKGADIALVSDAGTPVVSDPGGRLIRTAIEAGIRVEPVPGPSAALAALTASGLPGDSFTFLGFPPIRSHERTLWFERARSVRGTLVFFEAPHRIRRTLAELQAITGDCQITLARELTKSHEELVRGPISAVLTSPWPARGEFTIVADLGHLIDIYRPDAVGGAELLNELGRITLFESISRRQAIQVLARKHGRSPNEIYRAIEEAKHSVE